MDYLTTAQAGEQLGVNASRIRQLVLAGRLKFVKVGRDLMILRSAVAGFKRGTPGRPPAKKSRSRTKSA